VEQAEELVAVEWAEVKGECGKGRAVDRFGCVGVGWGTECKRRWNGAVIEWVKGRLGGAASGRAVCKWQGRCNGSVKWV
jgi:hypothetical protein